MLCAEDGLDSHTSCSTITEDLHPQHRLHLCCYILQGRVPVRASTYRRKLLHGAKLPHRHTSHNSRRCFSSWSITCSLRSSVAGEKYLTQSRKTSTQDPMMLNHHHRSSTSRKITCTTGVSVPQGVLHYVSEAHFNEANFSLRRRCPQSFPPPLHLTPPLRSNLAS